MATTSEDLAERSLLAAADGDDDTIAVLFERHPRRRPRRLHRPLPADADDVLAAAAEAVLAAIRRGNGPTEAFGPYLTTAVRRHAWRRTAEARHTTPGDVPDTPVDDASFDPIEADTVRRALAQLPPAQRDLLWLAEVEGAPPPSWPPTTAPPPTRWLPPRCAPAGACAAPTSSPTSARTPPDACGSPSAASPGRRAATPAPPTSPAPTPTPACAPAPRCSPTWRPAPPPPRGLLVLLPRRLAAPPPPPRCTPDRRWVGAGQAAPSTAAPEDGRWCREPCQATAPQRSSGAGAVAMVVLVAAVVTQLDRPEAASAGPTTSIAGAEDATTGASSAADAEAADDADADAAGETAPTMATGGSSTDAAPTSDAGDDEGTTGTRTAAAPTTAVPTATGPTRRHRHQATRPHPRRPHPDGHAPDDRTEAVRRRRPRHRRSRPQRHRPGC
ncbi:MAG: hypothetical protein R2699_11080 [Acidimicrobiales bacterium]